MHICSNRGRCVKGTIMHSFDVFFLLVWTSYWIIINQVSNNFRHRDRHVLFLLHLHKTLVKCLRHSTAIPSEIIFWPLHLFIFTQLWTKTVLKCPVLWPVYLGPHVCLTHSKFCFTLVAINMHMIKDACGAKPTLKGILVLSMQPTMGGLKVMLSAAYSMLEPFQYEDDILPIQDFLLGI